jgi:hypothetical protein
MRILSPNLCLIIILLLISCIKEHNDYRDPYVGFYKCQVNERQSVLDTSGVFHTFYSYYIDTIEVSKGIGDNMLKISWIPDVVLYQKTLTFEGFHTTGSFKNDSIEIYHFFTPIAISSVEYRGKKMQK